MGAEVVLEVVVDELVTVEVLEVLDVEEVELVTAEVLVVPEEELVDDVVDLGDVMVVVNGAEGEDETVCVDVATV